MAANFGLGLAALGRPGYINLGHADDLENQYAIGAMRQRAHAVLDAAWESGVKYFDVARSYGRAEEFLSSWIQQRGIRPQQINVGSKWGYTYTAAWQVDTPEGVEHEVKRHELSVLQSQYRATVNLLGNHLTLYQIHSATLESGVLENGEVLDLLGRIQDTGILIGLSVSGPRQSEAIEKALTIEHNDRLLFGCVQATWNLLEPSAGVSLKRAHENGLQVIIKEGVANGRLTTRNRAADFAQQHRLLGQVASELSTTIDGLALAAVLNQPWVTTVLSGAATIEHLRSNLSARDVGWDQRIEERLASLAETPQEYWATRSRLAWN